jgi:hypothetical protein
MKTSSIIALLAIALSLTACNKDEEQSIQLNQIFELDYRKSKSFDQGDFTITFENLIEDSRCPEGAECIWEGRAVVEIKIQHETDIDLHTLATSNSIDGDNLLSVQHDNYIIKLVAVHPYPTIASSPTNEDYSIELEITEE